MVEDFRRRRWISSLIACSSFSSGFMASHSSMMFYVLLLLSFAQIIFYHPTMMYLVAVFTGYGDVSISGDVDEQNAN